MKPRLVPAAQTAEELLLDDHHDQEMERAVLGCLLAWPETREEIEARLDPGDLYVSSYREILSAALSLETIDIQLLRAELERRGKLADVGGMAALTALDVDLPAPDGLTHWISTILEMAARRRLARACLSALRACRNGAGPGAAMEMIASACEETAPLIAPDTEQDAVTLEQMLDEEPEPPQEVIPNLLDQGDGLALSGADGTGKSIVGVALALACITGTPFLKWKVPEPVEVLLLDGELPFYQIRKRIASLAAGIEELDEGAGSRLHVISRFRSEKLGRPWPMLTSPRGLHRLESYLTKHPEIRLVIIDSASDWLIDEENPGIADNAVEGWARGARVIKRLRGRGLAVVALFHEGHQPGKIMGSSAKRRNFSQSFSIQRPEDFRPGEEHLRFHLHPGKMRTVHGIAGAADVLEVAAVPVPGGGMVLTWSTAPAQAAAARRSERIEAGAKAAALMSRGKSAEDVGKELGISRAQVYKVVKEYRQTRRGESPSPSLQYKDTGDWRLETHPASPSLRESPETPETGETRETGGR